MQLVAADIGNSSIRIAVEHGAHDERWSMETIIRGDETEAVNLSGFDIDREPALWAVSSVNKLRQQKLAEWVQQNRPHDRFHVIAADEVDLETDVVCRERLGRDRLIAAWQAVQLNESAPVIVIDAGTAVTIDLVDDEQIFQGGLIFPGARASLDSLARQTDALPDLANRRIDSIEVCHAPDSSGSANNPGERDRRRSKSRNKFVGKSTESAILLGVRHSQVSTIRAAVTGMAHRLGQTPAIFLTGGGIEELIDALPDSWEYVPDLVLQGALNIGREIEVKYQ